MQRRLAARTERQWRCGDRLGSEHEQLDHERRAWRLRGSGRDNSVDDDCDPATPDDVSPPDCGGLPLDTPTTSIELAKAMDLCTFAVECPATVADKKWGVLSTSLRTADGSSAAPPDVQAGVLASYGPYVSPKK